VSTAPTAILDVDGTLVDSNYQHTIAWYRAFREQGIVLPIWRIHRHMGMGGDKVPAALAGEEVERRLGDRLRERWQQLYDELLEEVEPFAAAHQLVLELKRRGHPVVLASSSIERHFRHSLKLLDVEGLVDGWTTKDDVERSKPDPDLVQAALEKCPTAEAVMVGDTPWDCLAAARAGVQTICVLTGGFCAAELREAGAVAVFESLEELCGSLDQTPLGPGSKVREPGPVSSSPG
jgi:HAD superfamily hydrolase (TIGR01549 family)